MAVFRIFIIILAIFPRVASSVANGRPGAAPPRSPFQVMSTLLSRLKGDVPASIPTGTLTQMHPLGALPGARVHLATRGNEKGDDK